MTSTSDATFGSLLDDAAKTASSAFVHGAAPFARVVDALGIARSASYTPVFQVMSLDSSPVPVSKSAMPNCMPEQNFMACRTAITIRSEMRVQHTVSAHAAFLTHSETEPEQRKSGV